MDVPANIKETMGPCEGLCGGDISHHLVDGLCPACRKNPNISTYKPLDPDMIPWKGGEQPVGLFTRVKVILAMGFENEGDAGDFAWNYDYGEANIIAYKVIGGD